jgi:hypothetical protein
MSSFDEPGLRIKSAQSSIKELPCPAVRDPTVPAANRSEQGSVPTTRKTRPPLLSYSSNPVDTACRRYSRTTSRVRERGLVNALRVILDREPVRRELGFDSAMSATNVSSGACAPTRLLQSVVGRAERDDLGVARPRSDTGSRIGSDRSRAASQPASSRRSLAALHAYRDRDG